MKRKGMSIVAPLVGATFLQNANQLYVSARPDLSESSRISVSDSDFLLKSDVPSRHLSEQTRTTGETIIKVSGTWDRRSAERLDALNEKFALCEISAEENQERKDLQALQMQDIPTRSYEEIVADATRAAREKELFDVLKRYVRDVKQGQA
jgi:hypothetical protein